MIEILIQGIRSVCSVISLLLILMLCNTNSFAESSFTQETMKLRLTDGVHLGTDIFLPATGKNFPAILIRTPYGKFQKIEFAEFWARHGYAVVLQDTRGKWTSEGHYIPFKNEEKDGLETLDWIVQQKWSNGKVGMFGSSYLSFCALTLAAAKHPALKSIFNISGWLKGGKINTPGGAVHLMLALPWILHEETLKRRSLNDYELEDLFYHLPLKNVFASIGVESKLWSEPEIIMELNKHLSAADIDVPIFHITGWNDFVYASALDIYTTVRDHSQKPQKLMIGPWFHDQYYSDYTGAGDEDFGEASKMGADKLQDLSLRWFDYTLKGIENGITREPVAEVFIMGKNKWQTFQQWPPAEIAFQKWYLSSESGANSLNGDGRLLPDPTARDAMDSIIFDPENPVPTNGGANFHFLLDIVGVKDQRDIEEREDVLVYTSAPLPGTIEIAGPLKVVFYAATEGPDTDFTAKFVEVRENGYARIIEEGIIRARHRNSLDSEEMLEPGKVYQFTIDLGATAIAIKKNHRLRVEISSSNFPKYDRNPNTGVFPFEATELKPVRQQVYHGKSFPSHILLPVINKSLSLIEDEGD